MPRTKIIKITPIFHFPSQNCFISKKHTNDENGPVLYARQVLICLLLICWPVLCVFYAGWLAQIFFYYSLLTCHFSLQLRWKCSFSKYRTNICIYFYFFFSQKLEDNLYLAFRNIIFLKFPKKLFESNQLYYCTVHSRRQIQLYSNKHR